MENNNNNQVEIVAVHKEGSDITQYKLSDGRIVGEQEIVNLAKQKLINNCIVSHRGNEEYVRSIPDDIEENNLQNLPQF